MFNDIVERMNSTLLQKLRTMGKTCKCKWNDKINKIKFAYDLRKHSVRGKKQYKLLFGRKSNLPVDFFLKDIKSLCEVQKSFKNIRNKRLMQ